MNDAELLELCEKADRTVAEMMTAEAYSDTLYPNVHSVEAWRKVVQPLREAVRRLLREKQALEKIRMAAQDVVDCMRANPPYVPEALDILAAALKEPKP